MSDEIEFGKAELRQAYPRGAYANLIMESGAEARETRAYVRDPADFVLVAPCDGRFFLGIYRDRQALEPDVVVLIPHFAMKGQPIQFG